MHITRLKLVGVRAQITRVLPAVMTVGLVLMWPGPESSGQPPPGLLGGTLSVDREGWAFRPSIAMGADGNPVVAWSQHRSPPIWEYSGTYVKRWANDRWALLGGRIGHVLGQLGAQWPEGYSPSIAVLGQIPYVGWYEGGGYGWGQAGNVPLRSSVFVAHWDGNQWVYDRNVEQPHGALNVKVGEELGGPAASARDPKLLVVGGLLYAAWIETRRTVGDLVVVKHLERGRWILDGPELSVSPGRVYGWITDLALADIGGALHVGWSEFSKGSRPGTVQVAKLSGGKWNRIGSSLSASPKGTTSYLALAAQGGMPVTAWLERVDAGNSVIHARRWDGQRWEPAGQVLNRDPAQGEAGRPAMASDGTRVWLAWSEAPQGKPASLYVRSLGPSGWGEASGPLNSDPAAGAADSPALLVDRGRVYVAWAEKNPPPATKQVYVRLIP